MKIGTTPKHTFTVPFDTELITAVEITYCQNGEVILQKNTDDCEMQGQSISTKLSQVETFKFQTGANVEIQIRLMDDTKSVFASDIISVSCQRCLSDEVLQ